MGQGHMGPDPHAPHAGAGSRGHAAPRHGRDKIDWSPEVWKRIDAAVREEIVRSRVAAKFLPTIYVPAKATTVHADIVSRSAFSDTSEGALTVDEAATTRINEYWVEFALTPAQVEEEEAAEREMLHGHGASTGISLATRAANVLAQVEDSIIFQGRNVFPSALFSGRTSAVNYRAPKDLDIGLLNILLSDNPPPLLGALPADQIVTVQPKTANGAYQENTVAAVARAFAILQGKGQYGPYALVLQTTPFADAYSPLPTTLITPAEPIRHLMTAGFYGTGTLPPFALPDGTMAGLPTTPANVLYTGVLVSLGGNTMDLVRGRLNHEEDVIVRFEQKDVDGNYRFRVVERFALRLKDITSVVQLQFLAS